MAFRMYLASTYLSQHQNSQAIALYRLIVQAAPNNVEVLNNLAALLQTQNDPSAFNYAKQAFSLQPENPVIADTYGWGLIQQGQFGAALVPLTLAANALTQMPSVQYHLAVALVKTGNLGKAKTILQNIIAAKQPFAERSDAIALQKQITGMQ